MSSQAFAVGVAVTQAKVVAVQLENGIPYINFDKPIGNPDSCAGVSWVVLWSDLPDRQSYLSMAMTALAAGKSVTVFVDGCGWSPWVATVPKVYAMQLLP